MAIRQIVDIVGDIISKLNFTVVITGNVDNGGGNHVLSMDNTYYLRKKKRIDIGGSEYVVTDFVFNQSITVKPSGHTTPIVVDSFELPAPLFFHGTVISTEREVILTMEKGPSKYPIVYLYENIKERFSGPKSKYLERESSIQLFFIDMYNKDNQLNDTLLDGTLRPLSNLDAQFLIEIRKSGNGIAKLTDDYDRMNLARFAITNFQGETKRIFNEYLSGVQLDITLPIKKC